MNQTLILIFETDQPRTHNKHRQEQHLASWWSTLFRSKRSLIPVPINRINHPTIQKLKKFPQPEIQPPTPIPPKKNQEQKITHNPSITNCIPRSCTKMPPFPQNGHQFSPNNNQNEKNSPAQTEEAHDWRMYWIKSGRNGDCYQRISRNGALESGRGRKVDGREERIN